jgi:hypothetical protein
MGCLYFMFIAKKKAGQSEFWIAADRVVTSTKGGFYARADASKFKGLWGFWRNLRVFPLIWCVG